MKKKLVLAIFSFCLIQFNFAQSPAQNSNWEIIFEDEFNGSTLDLTKWVKRNDAGRASGWFNPNNVSVSNGNLVIGVDDTPNYGKSHSGGEISTDTENGNFKYGYFEARLKIPYGDTEGRGYFPAFWLSVKHSDQSYKSYPPELDIVEYSAWNLFKAHGSNQMLSCLDWGNPAITYRGYWNLPNDPFEPYNNFHTYGMEWNEDEVKWYINDQQVGLTVRSEVPHDFMRLVISLQLSSIPNSGYGDINRPDAKMYVDWVKVWRKKNTSPGSDYQKWKRFWSSGWTNTPGKLGTWNLNQDDRFIIGDFDENDIDEVLSISASNRYAKQHEFNSDIEDWQHKWGNNGNFRISTWDLQNGDHFFAGKWHSSSVDYLLAISAHTGIAKMLRFDGSNWNVYWENNASGNIGSWNINLNDRFFVGDFNGDGLDDLLCISNSGNYAKIINFDSGNWNTLYGNGGSGMFESNFTDWNISSSNSFEVGDFNGNGKGDLLMRNDNSGYAKLFEFNSYTQWKYLWGNNGNGNLDNRWDLNPGNRLYAYNIAPSNNADEIFCMSPNGKYEKVLTFNGTNWRTAWGNNGSHQIDNRDLLNTDELYFGKFSSDASSTTQLLIKKRPWSLPVDALGIKYHCPETSVQLHTTPPSFSIPGYRLKSPFQHAPIDNIVAYPNPTNGRIMLSAKTKWQVYNKVNQLIMLGYGKDINLSSQPGGIYFVRTERNTLKVVHLLDE